MFDCCFSFIFVPFVPFSASATSTREQWTHFWPAPPSCIVYTKCRDASSGIDFVFIHILGFRVCRNIFRHFCVVFFIHSFGWLLLLLMMTTTTSAEGGRTVPSSWKLKLNLVIHWYDYIRDSFAKWNFLPLSFLARVRSHRNANTMTDGCKWTTTAWRFGFDNYRCDFANALHGSIYRSAQPPAQRDETNEK